MAPPAWPPGEPPPPRGISSGRGVAGARRHPGRVAAVDCRVAAADFGQLPSRGSVTSVGCLAGLLTSVGCSEIGQSTDRSQSNRPKSYVRDALDRSHRRSPICRHPVCAHPTGVHRRRPDRRSPDRRSPDRRPPASTRPAFTRPASTGVHPTGVHPTGVHPTSTRQASTHPHDRRGARRLPSDWARNRARFGPNRWVEADFGAADPRRHRPQPHRARDRAVTLLTGLGGGAGSPSPARGG